MKSVGEPNKAISVIVPIYNVATYISECINSILSQSFQDFELILVDDCGMDNSMEIVYAILLKEGYKQECDSSALAISQRECFVNGNGSSIIILHHEHNRGLSAARNTGMSVAEGEYILFVDSDDVLVPRTFELLYSKAQEIDANVVAGAYETFGDGLEPQVCGQVGGYVMAWNKLCRRSFLLENNICFIEGLIHEDCPWNFELTVTNKKFATVEYVTYRYRIRENSLQTGKDYQRHFDAYCRILQAYSDIICNRNVPDMLWIMEQQKALYFNMTMEKGTFAQLRSLYSLIRSLDPKPEFSKPDAHYSLPEWLGLMWYKKFHKYHLC